MLNASLGKNYPSQQFVDLEYYTKPSLVFTYHCIKSGRTKVSRTKIVQTAS